MIQEEIARIKIILEYDNPTPSQKYALETYLKGLEHDLKNNLKGGN